MSSYALRRVIGFGSFRELEEAASSVQAPVAKFVRDILQQNLPFESTPVNSDYRTGLQATFRGGKGTPLHDWFPYLEGYSPDFVNSIIQTFSPDAETVLDPFCGSGTTALVTAQLGRRALYCEVNPVCTFVIEAKAMAFAMSYERRQEVASRLIELATALPSQLRGTPRDTDREATAAVVFGKRSFFDSKTFDQVLRLRGLIDFHTAISPDIAVFLTVATLGSLVPASMLIRRGDLRFRSSSELLGYRPDLMKEVVEGLQRIASDLLDLAETAGSIERVCPDARLVRSVGKPIDAIITSPPYLNGTNYFRNTKIELWFLRHLSSRDDLRKFRDSAITAGINDVTTSKAAIGSAGNSKLLVRTLQALQEDAYDQRIPLMVRSYFAEMAIVAKALRAVCRDNAAVSIDLGDSCYGEVWVRTDQILADVMTENGFELSESILLRERQSRDGRKLSQTLQVFKASALCSPRTAINGSRPRAGWTTFRDELPHQRGEMAKRNWGHPWHSICSYQGKLKPSIAHTLTAALLPTSDGRVLDPFAGVGTVPFEARLQGHVAFGFDISPAAVAVSRAKLEAVDPVAVGDCLDRLNIEVSAGRPDASALTKLKGIRFNGPLNEYFHPQTLSEVLIARRYFKGRVLDGSEALVFASLLHILHGNRPYALSRRSHPITPFAPTGPYEYRSLIGRLRETIERRLTSVPSSDAPLGRALFQDATDKWPEEVQDLDAVITSPPFFDSTRFYSANWMRLWFAGWEAEDFARQPARFVDERQKRDLEVYDQIFAQAAERLRPGGHFAIHLGKSRKCDMATALTGIGARYLRLVDSFAESVEHCESHGIRDKGTVTHHQYVLFRRS